jgi:hypothetical protein
MSIQIPISRVYSILHARPLLLSDFDPIHKLVGKLNIDPAVRAGGTKSQFLVVGISICDSHNTCVKFIVLELNF